MPDSAAAVADPPKTEAAAAVAAPATGQTVVVQTTSDANATLYAGKFKGPEALEKATREITENLGLPKLPDGALFGPGKAFADVTALAADYTAKEALQGRLGNAKKEETKVEEKKPDAPKEMPKIEAPNVAPVADDDADYGQVLQKAGLTEEQVAAEWNEQKGKLKDETYAKLKTVGWGRKVVDRFIANESIARETVVGQVVEEIDTLSGGSDKRQTILQWAGTQYKGDALTAMNRRLENPTTAVDAWKAIMFDYSRSNGSAGSAPLASGVQQAQPTTAGFGDPGEYGKALDRYTRGIATEEDKRRIANTNPNLALRR